VSSDYYGSIAGEVADPDADAERAFLDWLNEFARRERNTSYQDDLREAFDAGIEYGRLEA
jgi:DNA invertase Pin-like site-specific DNA recombinase